MLHMSDMVAIFDAFGMILHHQQVLRASGDSFGRFEISRLMQSAKNIITMKWRAVMLFRRRR